MLLLKANSLAAGRSGVRTELVDALLALLERRRATRSCPSRGSVGASGDLAPLAHLSLCLIGEGEATARTDRALAGRRFVGPPGSIRSTLEAKEGLALINGTQLSLALALEGLFRAETLLDAAIVDRLPDGRRTRGQLHAVRHANPRGESLAPSDRGCATLSRCCSPTARSVVTMRIATASRIPTPCAACRRCSVPSRWCSIMHATFWRSAINGVTDNPLIFGDDILSGGNFHAEPLAMLSDYLAIAVAELASMSERRTDLLDRRVNPALNMFLTTEPGLESGFMIAHVAAAALTSENRTLAHPASVDNVPTSAGQEDHVSMAPWAGLKLLRICDEHSEGSRRLNCSLLPMRSTSSNHSKQPSHCSACTRSCGSRSRYRPYDHRLDRDIEALARLIEGRALSAVSCGQSWLHDASHRSSSSLLRTTAAGARVPALVSRALHRCRQAAR